MGERVTYQLVPRDVEVLKGLFESRVMTRKHIAELYFDGKAEMTKKRLQILIAAGLVKARPRRAAEPGVLFLSRNALQLLIDEGHIAESRASLAQLTRRAHVSERTLRHELEVMDVKAAFVNAARGMPNIEIAEFSTRPSLYEFESYKSDGTRVLVQPDGFIRIRQSLNNGELLEHSFFLEVDRSNEVLEILAERAHCYGEYYRSGEFAVRCGGTADQAKEFPFRVLYTLKTEARRNNVAKRLLMNDPPVMTQVVLTTTGEAVQDPLGATWTSPTGYRSNSGEGTFPSASLI